MLIRKNVWNSIQPIDTYAQIWEQFFVIIIISRIALKLGSKTADCLSTHFSPFFSFFFFIFPKPQLLFYFFVFFLSSLDIIFTPVIWLLFRERDETFRFGLVCFLSLSLSIKIKRWYCERKREKKGSN